MTGPAMDPAQPNANFGVTLVSRLRARLLTEYVSGLLTSYMAMGANIVMQVVLVPVYLATLGTEGFGSLTLVLGLISYSAVGIGWVSGGLQRLLGETYGLNDHAAFARNVAAGKMLLLGYSILAALVGMALYYRMPHAQLPLAAAIAAALFLLASNENSVERMALSATGRQAAANILLTAQLSAYALSVLPVLLLHWGLTGVFACQLGSVLAARSLVPLVWRGARPVGQFGHMEALRGLIDRLRSPMGAGYFIFGFLVLSAQSDVLLVGWLGGAEAAARFVLIWKFAEVAAQMLWRISESLAPILVRLDAAGNRDVIRQRYRKVAALLLVTASCAGLAYVAFGPWITRLWLGSEHAPTDPLGFALAGAGLVWVGLARLPAILAYSLAKFYVWNGLFALELIGRIGLTIALYPRIGYLAPLAALNIVHVCGLAFAYQWAGWRLLNRD